MDVAGEGEESGTRGGSVPLWQLPWREEMNWGRGEDAVRVTEGPQGDISTICRAKLSLGNRKRRRKSKEGIKAWNR